MDTSRTENKNEQENLISNNVFSIQMILGWLKFLIKNWWVFLIVGILAGLAGVFYATMQKPEFESRLTFALDAGANESGLSGAMDLAAQFGLGFGNGQSMFDGDNILEIMKSRRMIENVLLSTDTFNEKPYTLIEYYLEKSDFWGKNNNPRISNIHFPVGVEKPSLSYLQDSILYNVYSGFAANDLMASRPDRKISIYEVKVRSNDEKFTKDFTDRIVNETNAYYTELSSKKDKETLDILEQRVESMKDKVGSSIDEKAYSQDANVNTAFAKGQSQSYKQQYNVQAYGEAYKEMFKTLELARFQYLKKLPLLQIIDHADYPMEKIKLGKLKSGLIFSIIACLFTLIILYAKSLVKRQMNREGIK